MNDKKCVRSGIIGAGFSGSFHFEAISKVYGTNVEVQGVHALDLARVSQAWHETGLK
jgi:hypothetical protein